MPAANRWLRRTVVTSLITLLLTGLLAAQPATAVVPDAPSGLTPMSGDFASNPTLSWERVIGSTSYKVELSATPTFSSLISGAGTAKTVNVHFTPPVALPAGTIYWRVAAMNSSGASDYAVGRFTRAAVGVPELRTPAPGERIDAPTQPVTYSWDPVPGAAGYQLQVDDDREFTNAAAPTNLTRASYTVTTLPPVGERYWRVRAKLSSSIVSDWSEVRSFSVELFQSLTEANQSPTLPPNDANVSVQDVVLDWVPIAGAVKYDLQIALDDQFLNVVHSRSGIVASRYSPPAVLANDQYWWRIRPIDAAGHAAEWNGLPVWRFQRNWPDQAHLQYPADGAVLTNPDQLFFQWSGVHLASTYTVQLATNPDFSGTVKSCETVNTTLTPAWDDAFGCMPAVGTTYYWRVRSTDEPASGSTKPQTNPLAEDADVYSFTYAPTVVEQASPSQGETVTVPTMRWSAVSGAATYKVTLTSASSGSNVVSASTTGTSYTPRSMLKPGTYRWQVQAFSAKGVAISNPLLPQSQPTFSVVDASPATASSPTPLSTPMDATARFPTLTWTPVVAATRYKVRVKRAENLTWSTLSPNFEYPAGEDTGTGFLSSGTYDWQVDAFNGNMLLATGSMGQFAIAQPGAVTGHQVALVGTDLNSADPTRSCTGPRCENLRQTPVLSWDPDPDAARYELILSADPVLTDNVDRRIEVYGTSWIDDETLADANAEEGTYWAVISCSTTSICPLRGPATHVFNKQSPRVTLKSPANGATNLHGEVALSWEDWLSKPDLLANTSLNATDPTMEARYYQIQTSTAPDFSRGVMDSNVSVDQTTFTSPTDVYPDGPVYWRVRAVDGSGRASAWSLTRNFSILSPAPVPSFPGASDTFSPGDVFAWMPLPLAASYEIKIIKNDGTSRDAAVGQTGSKAGIQQTTYAPTATLALDPVPGIPDDYLWFIRRKNASGGNGQWSEGVPFRVVGDVPTPTSPALNAVVEPRGGVFTWRQVDGAATYRVEDRAVGASASAVNTVALSYAPTSEKALGNREWRVVAIDADGNTLGVSSWSSYSVQGINGKVSVSGRPAVGGSLTALVNWQPNGVATSFQWRRGSSNISGATGSAYTVTAADVGKPLTVRVTGSKQGYASVTLTSAAVTGSTGTAPQVITSPTITGTAKIGYTLTTSNGTWTPAPSSYAYQWLRNGRAISGATAKSYKVTVADPGTTLKVRITARRTGHSNGSALSSGRVIPKVATTTAARFVDATIRRAAYPKMTVTLNAPGIAGPTGYIRFYEGSRRLKTVYVGAARLGRLTVTLPKRSPGYHYIVVKYAGSTKIKPSNSKRVQLHVRR